MWKFYYDYLRGQWNVYFVDGDQEDYECSFSNIQDAQNYCDEKNSALINGSGA